MVAYIVDGSLVFFRFSAVEKSRAIYFVEEKILQGYQATVRSFRSFTILSAFEVTVSVYPLNIGPMITSNPVQSKEKGRPFSRLGLLLIDKLEQTLERKTRLCYFGVGTEKEKRILETRTLD